MALETTRRSLITGLIAFVAAPAIVRAGNLMPVKVMDAPIFFRGDYGRSPQMFMLSGGDLYEIWWMPGESSPRIKNVTLESCG